MFRSSDFKWFSIQIVGLCALFYILDPTFKYKTDHSNTGPVLMKTRWDSFVQYSNDQNTGDQWGPFSFENLNI